MLNKLTNTVAKELASAGKAMENLSEKTKYMEEERLIKAIAEYEEKIRKMEERLVEIRNERIGVAS